MTGSRLVIVGAGGFAREVAEIARVLYPSLRLGFVDDAPSNEAAGLMTAKDVTNLGAARSWEPQSGDVHVIAIGDPAARAILAELLTSRSARFLTLIHPDSTVAVSATVGRGVVVAPGARVSADVILGHHVHVDQNVAIGHDTTVADFVRLNPSACLSGSVVVEVGGYVGAAAVVLQGLRIGAGSVVGAGAVVTRDVPAAFTVKGVPAR